MGDAAHMIGGGAMSLGFAVTALFFLRFWRDTRDGLFGLFAVAFFILAANRVGLAALGAPGGRDRLYWIRLLAFAVILFAVWNKNRARTPR